MPQSRNRPKPPPAMTWGRAIPILVLCVIFDALRFFFNMFWFFGPAMAALVCTVAGSNTSVGQFVGTTATAAVCSTAAGVAGFFGAVPIEAFGVIMAMAVGLIGWLTIFLIQLMNNVGIFRANFSMIIRFGLSLLLSEIPIVSALPSLTIINVTMFNIQIKKGREAEQKWEEEHATEQSGERREQAGQLMQARAAKQARLEGQKAANSASYTEPEEAAPMTSEMSDNVLPFRVRTIRPAREVPTGLKKAA